MTATLLSASTAGTPQFGSTTFIFAFLLVAMIACLALEEKLHAKKSVIVGLFAVVALLLAAAMDGLGGAHTGEGETPVRRGAGAHAIAGKG